MYMCRTIFIAMLGLLLAGQAMANDSRFDRAQELAGAEATMEAQDYRQATRHYLRLLTIEPDNADWQASLAKAYYKQGKTQQAEDYAQQALKNDAGSLQALLVLGQLRAKQQNWQQAHDYYELAVKKNPDSDRARTRLAIAEGQLGIREDAEPAP